MLPEYNVANCFPKSPTQHIRRWHGMAEAQKTRSAHGMDGQQSKINQLVCNKRAWESETATSYWHNPYFDPREKNQWENSRIIQSCRCRAIQSVFHDMLSVISQLSIIAGSPHLPIIGFFGCLINVTLFYPTNDDLAFNQKTLQSDLEPNLTRYVIEWAIDGQTRSENS